MVACRQTSTNPPTGSSVAGSGLPADTKAVIIKWFICVERVKMVFKPVQTAAAVDAVLQAETAVHVHAPTDIVPR